MEFSVPKRITQLITVLLATVVFLLAVFAGMAAGKGRAQSLVVAQNAQELAKGIKYFYNDNGRFPALLEYQNQNLMLNYFNYFPPFDFVSGNCPGSFIYKKNTDSYQLNFCLPKAVGGFGSGWNRLETINN